VHGIVTQIDVIPDKLRDKLLNVGDERDAEAPVPGLEDASILFSAI